MYLFVRIQLKFTKENASVLVKLVEHFILEFITKTYKDIGKTHLVQLCT